jgi:N-acetylglucosaminyl-diphospho-decaprenol L-rhamnosyltransferase
MRNMGESRRILDKNGESPGLSIVITNYDGKNFIGACLSSIKENLHPSDVETIVIDNSSSDGSPEFIKEKFRWVKLICNHQNLGYARANNQGIKEAKGEFILLLNPDTVVRPHSIDILEDEMRLDPTIGAAGPALLCGEDCFQVSFGVEISFWHEVLQKSLLNRHFRKKLKKMRNKRQVGWLSGACILTRKSVLEKVGFFDEGFYLYFEDIDLCRRIRGNGWKVFFIPRAKIFHLGGGSTTKLKKRSRYHYRQSQLAYYKKHCSRISLFLLRAYLRMNFALLLVSDYFKRDRDTQSALRLLKLLKKDEKN